MSSRFWSPRFWGSEFCTSEVKPLQEAKANQAVKNQEYRYDEIEEPRHDQDQNAGNERHDRRDMGDGQGHLKTLREGNVGEDRFGAGILGAIADACGNAGFPRLTKN